MYLPITNYTRKRRDGGKDQEIDENIAASHVPAIKIRWPCSNTPLHSLSICSLLRSLRRPSNRKCQWTCGYLPLALASTSGMFTKSKKKKNTWKSWVHRNVPNFARVCLLLIAKEIWWLGCFAYRHRKNFNLLCCCWWCGCWLVAPHVSLSHMHKFSALL